MAFYALTVKKNYFKADGLLKKFKKEQKMNNKDQDKLKSFQECITIKSEFNRCVLEPEQINKQALALDCDKIATEILIWLTKNVENFIDNQTKQFKIDLILDKESKTVEEMEETKKLQDLYQALPDSNEEDVEIARKNLDETTAKAYKNLTTKKDLLEKLFERMAYYYELVGVSKGKMLINKLVGSVSITKFEYESFLEYAQGEDGERFGEKKSDKLIREYTIPEGFTIWIEIAFTPKTLPKSIF